MLHTVTPSEHADRLRAQQPWFATAVTFHSSLQSLMRQTERQYDDALNMDLREFSDFGKIAARSANLQYGAIFESLVYIADGQRELAQEQIEQAQAIYREVEPSIERFQEILGPEKARLFSIPEGSDRHQTLFAMRQLLSYLRTIPNNRELVDKLQAAVPVPEINPQILVEHDALLLHLADHTDNVISAALMRLVIHFEALMSDVLRLYYQHHPSALPDTHRLSLNEFARLGSHEKAVQYVIDTELDQFMRGSLENWQDFFEKQFKLDLTKFGGSWEEIIELFQRRNVLVHNAGKVSRQYLYKVPKRLTSDLHHGEALFTDLAYVQRSTGLILALGLHLLNGVWESVFRREIATFRIQAISFVATKVLKAERWSETELLFQLLLEQKGLDAREAMLARLNMLLARKRLHGMAAIQKDLDAFEYGVTAPFFAALAYALAEDIESFLNLYPQSALTPEQLQTAPIFAEFRENPRFKALYTPKKEGRPRATKPSAATSVEEKQPARDKSGKKK